MGKRHFVVLFHTSRIMTEALEYVINKFPDHRSRLIESYKDEDFRLLCDDFLATAQSIEASRKNVIQERDFENEYVFVFLELERRSFI